MDSINYQNINLLITKVNNLILGRDMCETDNKDLKRGLRGNKLISIKLNYLLQHFQIHELNNIDDYMEIS